MDVIALVLFVLLAIGLVSMLGFPLGIFAWLVVFALFRKAMSSLLKHICD